MILQEFFDDFVEKGKCDSATEQRAKRKGVMKKRTQSLRRLRQGTAPTMRNVRSTKVLVTTG